MAELVQDDLGEDVTLTDLGQHRLKDLGRPEHVYQVCAPRLPDRFPPLLSLDHPSHRHNLPAQYSSIVGRQREVAQLHQLMTTRRLVSLVGPVGAGKTRLALQVAADRVEAGGVGVWFVDLAPLADPSLVAESVAVGLGVRPDPGRDVIELLLDVLRDDETLILLDNCEHLLDAVALFVDRVLLACPKAVLMATTREPIGLAGEHVYRVPSLDASTWRYATGHRRPLRGRAALCRTRRGATARIHPR